MIQYCLLPDRSKIDNIFICKGAYQPKVTKKYFRLGIFLGTISGGPSLPAFVRRTLIDPNCEMILTYRICECFPVALHLRKYWLFQWFHSTVLPMMKELHETLA